MAIHSSDPLAIRIEARIGSARDANRAVVATVSD
jgi:hypothetical protein